MSIPLLPEFDTDGYQLEPTTADINDLIAAANTAAGAAIATLPTFTADGYQVEPSIAKLNEIITALNDGGATLDLLPTFAADGYETIGLTVEGVAIDLSDLQEIYAGGVNLELLESSGATGTRTAVLSGASDVNRITAALIALNPA